MPSRRCGKVKDVYSSDASKPKNEKPSSRNIGLTPDDQRRMADLYVSGKSCQEIAALFGCSAPNVSYTLKKLGVKMRPRTVEGKIPIEKHPQVIQLYQAGKSCNEITATSKLPAIYLGVFVREKRVATKSRVKKKQPVKKKAKRPPEKPATKQRMLDFRD